MTVRRGVIALAATTLLAVSACGAAGSDPVAAGPAVAAAPAVPPSPIGTTTAPPTPAAPVPGDPAPPPATTGPAPRWQPPARTTWQYQLDGSLDLGVAAAVFDVDWEDTTADQVRQLHAAGRHVVCYVNAGAFEDWRADAASYPAAVLGRPLEGWQGERWLDVRRLDILLPLIAARMDVCRSKGFDAVEPDNVDGYTNSSGFPLTAQDQLRFDRAVAQLAHDRHLAVALKNDVEQIPDLEPDFDFAVNEECLVSDECDAYRPFVGAGKAVLHVEYRAPDASGCRTSLERGLNTIVKDVDLGADLKRC